MTATIVILDHRRSEGDRLVAMIRRDLISKSRKAELDIPIVARNRVLRAHLVEGPATSLYEVAKRADFLLDRLTRGEDRSAPEIRTLTRRLLHDILRLAGIDATEPCD